jgi:hypothetical protein
VYHGSHGGVPQEVITRGPKAGSKRGPGVNRGDSPGVLAGAPRGLHGCFVGGPQKWVHRGSHGRGSTGGNPREIHQGVPRNAPLRGVTEAVAALGPRDWVPRVGSTDWGKRFGSAWWGITGRPPGWVHRGGPPGVVPRGFNRGGQTGR